MAVRAKVISSSDFRNLQPGDKVRIVPEWNGHSGQNTAGYMDKYLNRVVTIEYINTFGDARIEEDKDDQYQRWNWNRFCFCEIIPSREYEPESDDALADFICTRGVDNEK